MLKSLGDVGAVVTNMVMGVATDADSGRDAQDLAANKLAAATSASEKEKENALVMQTKLKIIEILQVDLSVFAKFLCPFEHYHFSLSIHGKFNITITTSN